MRRAILAGLLVMAGPAWGQAMIQPAPDNLVCQQEWRRFHSELGRFVIRLRCNDGKFSAAVAEPRYQNGLWSGVLTCAQGACGEDSITLQLNGDIPDGTSIGCQEAGRAIPREWFCKAAR